jgi:hypothetical protein
MIVGAELGLPLADVIQQQALSLHWLDRANLHELSVVDK